MGLYGENPDPILLTSNQNLLRFIHDLENAPMSFAVSLVTLLVTTFGPHRSALGKVSTFK